MLFWQSIKDSLNPEFFQAYLSQYPQGVIGSLAKVEIGELRQTKMASLVPLNYTVEALDEVLVALRAANVLGLPQQRWRP